MEAHLTSSNDTIIAGLHFKPPSQTAAYCLTNRHIRYVAESGNLFDPVSSRVIRFRIAGDQGFLEASSVRLQFTLTNLKSDATLTPISQGLSLFSRARFVARRKWWNISQNCTRKQQRRIASNQSTET